MLAYEITGSGGLDQLICNNRPVPRPAEDEVLIRVKASSINYRDLMTVLDPVPRGINFPRIPNSDCAGIVEEIGQKVSRVAVGDRVSGIFMQDWLEGEVMSSHMLSALGGTAEGVLAEFIVLKEKGVVKIPDNLSFDEAATLPCAAVTAWHSLFEIAPVKPDSRVLLIGTGGVSIAALQFCVMVGAKTILISSSEEKLQRAKALGANTLINYKKEVDWDKIVLSETSGEGVDHVVEVGGAGTLEKSIKATRVGGSIGLIGVLTGGEINPTAIMRKSINIKGIYVGSRKMFEDMNAAISRNDIHPVIDERFSFQKAKDAFEAMREAKHFGKLVITT